MESRSQRIRKFRMVRSLSRSILFKQSLHEPLPLVIQGLQPALLYHRPNLITVISSRTPALRANPPVERRRLIRRVVEGRELHTPLTLVRGTDGQETKDQVKRKPELATCSDCRRGPIKVTRLQGGGLFPALERAHHVPWLVLGGTGQGERPQGLAARERTPRWSVAVLQPAGQIPIAHCESQLA